MSHFERNCSRPWLYHASNTIIHKRDLLFRLIKAGIFRSDFDQFQLGSFAVVASVGVRLAGESCAAPQTASYSRLNAQVASRETQKKFLMNIRARRTPARQRRMRQSRNTKSSACSNCQRPDIFPM
jgi:hypothetical protein